MKHNTRSWREKGNKDKQIKQENLIIFVPVLIDVYRLRSHISMM